jgi:hypothetical protein
MLSRRDFREFGHADAEPTTVLSPISTAGLSSADVDQLTLDTREKMLKVLQDFAKDPGSKAVLKASAEKVL